MKLAPGHVLVLPDSQNKDVKADVTSAMQLSKAEDYNTGTVIKVGPGVPEEFPFGPGDWIHYRPVVGYKVFLDIRQGQVPSESFTYHKIFHHTEILIAPFTDEQQD